MKPYLLLLLLTISNLLLAQTNTFKLSGQLVDQGQLPLANIALELGGGEDFADIVYATSDTEGKFIFNDLSAGNYLLRVGSLEYAEMMEDIQIVDQDITMDNPLVLEPNNNELDEVTVLARKKPTIEVKPDKVVFNVQNSATSGGLNGLELLRKSPGVSIDKDNNILLKGSAGTRVFINGKPSYMDGKQLGQWLSSLRAEDIEKIEIISNPSAKYEAEGSGGIINFVLRTGVNKGDGINGSINTTFAGLLQNGKYQGTYNALINYMHKGTSIVGSYGYSHGTEYFRLSANRTQDRYYREVNLNNNQYKNHNFRLNLDQQLNDKHSISAGIRLGFFNDYNPQNAISNIDTLIGSRVGDFIEQLNTQTTNNNNDVQIVPSIGYMYKDKKFGELSINADYSSWSSETINTVNNNYYFDEGSTQQKSASRIVQDIGTSFKIIAAKADWDKSWDKVKLEAGFKYSRAENNNELRQSTVDIATGNNTLDLTRSNTFIYEENIYAAYVQTSFTIKKFGFVLGLRDEYTTTVGTSKDIQQGNILATNPRNYNGIFPTASVAFTPNRMHTITLAYSRRLQRPAYGDLNPFSIQQSELNFERGNPNLTPEYTDKIELNYTLFGMVNLSTSYVDTKDVIFPTFNAEGQISFRSTDNIGQRQSWNINLSTPLMLKSVPWWSGFLSHNFNYATNKGVINNEYLEVSALGFNGYMESSFRLPKKFTFEVSGWFVTPSVWAASIEHQAAGSLDIALQKKLFNDKLTVKAFFRDVLSTAYFRFINRLTGAQLDNGVARWGSRNVGVTLSYSFGSKPQNQRRRDPGAVNEEEQRLQGGGNGFGG